MPPPQTARCSKHPEATAVDACQRCGAFICAECAQIRTDEFYCADCLPFLNRPVSPRPAVAFGAAGLAPVLLVICLAIGGWVSIGGLAAFTLCLATALALLGQERAARRRGDAPAKGFLFTLAWVVVALDLIAIVGVVGAICLFSAIGAD